MSDATTADEAVPSRGPLSAEDAALYLGGGAITANTLRALVRRKQIGYLRIGRATVFPQAALDAYIEAHTVKPTANPHGLTDASLQRIRDGRATRRAS